MAKARALASRRNYALPEDVQAAAVAVLSHRVIVAPEARASGFDGAEAIREAVESAPVPA
jgi:MoxR-like ATPase